jgi:tripartite-type tricarboxylate transporter receptor subunit TctC
MRKNFRGGRARLLVSGAALALLITACGGSNDTAAPAPAPAPEPTGPTEPVCENWLTRPGTFVVPYNPGGSTDPVGRRFATSLEEYLGQTWAVDNIAGGGAAIGTAAVVAFSEPDGSVLGLSSNSALEFQPLINPDVPYRSADDYAVIMKLVDLPAVLIVKADSPYQTLEEFLEDARARPDELTVSTSGNLTQPDQNILLLNELAGIQLRNVPFSGGGGEALTALLAGQVDANMGYGPSVKGQIDAGEARVLGVIGDEPYYLFPEATPFGQLGYDIDVPAWYGIVANPNIPADLLACIRQLSVEAFDTPENRAWAEDNGYRWDPADHVESEQQLARIAEGYKFIYENFVK